MSLYQSPKIVTDGLAFYYDMSNTQKSWKGRPVTNLVDPSWSSWSIDGSGQGSIGTRTIDASYECTIVDNNANTRQSIYISSGITAGTTYTFSVQYKKNYGTPTLRFQIQAYNGSTYLSTMSFATTAQLGILDIGEWQTAKITLTTPASTNRILWFMQDGDDYVAYTHSFSLKNVQCEQNSFATPFVDGTRSNTQSILDLTTANTITASSLTYASDGTFSFDRAASNSIVTNLPITATRALSNFTYEVILNVTSLPPASNNGVILGATYYAGAAIYWRTSGSNFNIRGFIRGADAYRTTAEYTLSLNTVYHIVMTNNYSAGTLNLYVNGILFSSVATATQEYNPSLTPGLNIGVNLPQVDGGGAETYSYFTGKVHSAKVYYQALTAAEVQQNFNAQKSRYTGYQTMTYTAISNVTLTNNGTQEVSMFKNSDNAVWNGEVRSTEAFSAPCTIEFSKQAASGDNGASYAMIGWNEDPTSNTSYSSIDHASYPFMMDRYEVYNNGSYVNPGQTWDSTKRFYIVYDTDGFIRHYNGSTLLYSANYGTNKTVYVDSSLYSVNSTFGGFSNVKVARSSWNGTNYV